MDTIRKLLRRLSDGISSFMSGRYGMDKLNFAILWTSLGIGVLAMFLPFPPVRLGMVAASYVLMFWAVFRCFSRNIYKRYRENRRFLMLTDRKNRYFECPKCHQLVRVPRKKGKIAITCPKCREVFVKKT